MNILTLDFETYFDDDYSLKKMTTEAYVRDPRFEALMVGIRWGNEEGAHWYSHEDFKVWAATVPWDKVAVLCHHAHFDGLILSHHYGVKPHAWLDTLSMARLQLGNHLSVGLESLARHYGLAGKSVPYEKFRGRHWCDIGHDLRAELGSGCLHDIELTWDIFNRLRGSNENPFPEEEYKVIDFNIRMFTEPKIVGNVEVLAQVWTQETARKKQLLFESGVTAAELQSADKFAALLRARDIEPEMKDGKNGPIYAFASTDSFMQDFLLVHEEDGIRLLAEARIAAKSNGALTRAERLGWMATRGPMPVYLHYCGAHTTRWSGGDKVNWQNFKRGSLIRKAMYAPTGHTIVKADKSQIECRILNYVAEQWDVIERFRSGVDPYTGIASAFYGREITRADPAERGVGKQLELSCGYGAGGDTIVRTAKRGTYGPPVLLTPTEGLAARDLYRSTHPGVVAYWKQARRIISALGGPSQPTQQWGPLAVTANCISLNGIPIWYPELHFHRDEDGEEYWRYKSRKGWVKLYGGKLVENVVQFMSRVDMSQSLLRILKQTNIRPAQLEHDAAVWVVPNDLVEPFKAIVEAEMTRAPVWLPGIPLACEITTGETM